MPGRPFESIIKELCEEVLSEHDPRALPDKIIHHVQRVFPVDWATLWVTEQKEASDAKRLRLAAASPMASRLLTAESGLPAVYDFGEGLTGYIAEQTEAIRINKWEDFSKYPHAKKYDGTQYRDGSAERDCKCVLGVPLLLKSVKEDAAAEISEWRVIGVLKLENIRETEDHPVAHFTDTDVAFVVAYGAVIAVALEKAQMRVRSIEVGQGLLDISRDLLANLGERPDFKTIVEKTATVISAEACALWLRKGLNLFLEEASGYPNCPAPENSIPYHLGSGGDSTESLKGVGLTVFVGKTLLPLNLKTSDEVRTHVAWRGANDVVMWGKPHGLACYSLIAIPLVDGETGDLKGVFKIENKRPTIFQRESYFSSEDQKLLQTLGNSICLSLIISERIDRLRRLERLVGNIRVLDGPDAALYFILTGLTHGEGLQYNRALVFQKRQTSNSTDLVCTFALGHLDPDDWDREMKSLPSPNLLDFDSLLESFGEDSPVYGSPIFRYWCDQEHGRRVSLSEPDSEQLLAKHVKNGEGVKMYNSGRDLAPGDILAARKISHGFTADDCDFVLLPIFVERDLWGVIYADNRFTGNRINTFECHVLQLFAGIASSIVQAAEGPGRLRDALQKSSAMVAHKLRNVFPIGSDHLDQLSARLSTAPSIDDNALRSLEIALDENRHAQVIVDEFDQFGRSQRLERHDELTVSELIEELKTQVERRAKHHVTTRVRAGDLKVKVNLRRLKDDFIAFAGDTIRCKKEKLNITIEAETPSAEQLRKVKLPASRHYVKLTYTDNGPGVPAALKEKIFEPFFTTTPGGNGLGLAIADYCARGHDGCIVETGIEGRGVRFELYLTAR